MTVLISQGIKNLITLITFSSNKKWLIIFYYSYWFHFDLNTESNSIDRSINHQKKDYNLITIPLRKVERNNHNFIKRNLSIRVNQNINHWVSTQHFYTSRIVKKNKNEKLPHAK